MRLLAPAALIAFVACGEKKPPEAAAEEATAAVEEAPAPVAEPEPEPEPEPTPPPEPEPPANNADVSLSVSFGDGTTASGHISRIERSSDWYGEMGWEDSASKLTIELEGNGTLRDATWNEIKSISIAPGAVSSATDCTYSSEYSPWMYTCELRTPSTAITTDGKKWKVNTRHKWKFIYDDGTEVEFWLTKHPARMQDTEAVTLDTVNPENYAIYQQLQDQLRTEVKSTVRSIKAQ